MHEILTSKDFYEKYKDSLIPGEFKFITKAYRQSDNTIAIFEKENNVDCYFQLPNYKTTRVPDKRKWVYKLPKGYIKTNGHIEMDDGRYKIPVDDLELWRNPYTPDEPMVEKVNKEFVEQFTPEPVKEPLLDRMKRLEKEAEERCEKLELAIEKMRKMEEKITETLSKLSHAD
jgi:hypothetical protein